MFGKGRTAVLGVELGWGVTNVKDGYGRTGTEAVIYTSEDSLANFLPCDSGKVASLLLMLRIYSGRGRIRKRSTAHAAAAAAASRPTFLPLAPSFACTSYEALSEQSAQLVSLELVYTGDSLLLFSLRHSNEDFMLKQIQKSTNEERIELS